MTVAATVFLLALAGFVYGTWKNRGGEFVGLLATGTFYGLVLAGAVLAIGTLV